MKLNSFYPVIKTKDLKASRDFYLKYFPFEVTFEADWYLSLITQTEPRFQLAFVNYDHPSVPQNFQRPAHGLLLNFEVENVDALHRTLIEDEKLPVELELRSEPWGQRHFMTRDPNGLLLDLIQLIEPSPEFLAQYSDLGQQELNETLT